MFIVVFLAAFAAVALVGWIIYALMHPVLAGQGFLIFLCKAAGVIALLSALGLWISQSFAQAIRVSWSWQDFSSRPTNSSCAGAAGDATMTRPHRGKDSDPR